MTRICFIENRGTVALWQTVAATLRGRGHQIGWIVQNHAFLPRDAARAGDWTAVIPYPRQSDLAPANSNLLGAIAGDRGVLYFGKEPTHYRYYADQISAALDAFRPDAVIGEPTLFHEQLAILQCRRRGIPYLHAVTSRYPGDRFQVVEGDTQIPVSTPGEVWADDRLRDHVDGIRENRVVPTYMLQTHAPGRLDTLSAGLNLWLAHLAGEGFNTPSLRRKMRLTALLKQRLAQWEQLARPVPPGCKALLYPLQMQPEANINVWGRPYSDQLATIKAMLAAAPDNIHIAIKANPKAKYEVTEDLIALARSESRIILLPLRQSMSEAQAATLGSLTVTGTVGLEAVFGKGRCLSLCHPVITEHLPAFHISSIAEGVQRLLDDPTAGLGTEATALWLLGYLISTSYPGIISEPLLDQRVLQPANVTLVADGLEDALNTVLSQSTASPSKELG